LNDCDSNLDWIASIASQKNLDELSGLQKKTGTSEGVSCLTVILKLKSWLQVICTIVLARDGNGLRPGRDDVTSHERFFPKHLQNRSCWYAELHKMRTFKVGLQRLNARCTVRRELIKIFICCVDEEFTMPLELF
jgi:hypothetical protein